LRKNPKPFITKIQAEGARADKKLIREELRKEADKFAVKMPTSEPDRLMYVRNLLTKALVNQIDKEVFKEFIRMTNSYYELQHCMARALKPPK